MRTRALLLRLIVPAGLVVLVGVLATLQYRWLGSVSEAERERLQTSLRQRASEFADDFDRELLRVYLALQSNCAGLQEGDWTAFARGYDGWRDDTRYPQIVRDVYLVSDDGATIRRYAPDQRAFTPVEWPAALEPIRTQTAGVVVPDPRDEKGRALRALFRIREPLVASIPALVVPISAGPAPMSSSASSVYSIRFGGSSLVVVLDRDALQGQLLSALVAKHFTGQDADSYRLAVLDAQSGTSILTRGVPAGGTLDAARADATVPFFTLRPDLAGQVAPRTWVMGTSSARIIQTPGPGSPSGSAAAPSKNAALSIYVESRGQGGDTFHASTPTLGRPAWRLVLQHPSGSLDAAVAAARRRNLWLGFGILAVLAAGVGLVVVNAQRSERLAAQQMDFVATVSHELRTPLAVIRSAAQNLSAGVVHEPGQARRYGDLIETEGRRLTSMIEQVLEFAGLSGNRRPPEARSVDAGAVVRDVVSACRTLFDAERCAVAVDIADDAPRAMVDEDGLRRAVHNLVTNALKYGADGRWIGLAVRRGTWRGREDVQVSVSDRGRGIEPDDAAHIFEPFYRGRYAKDRQIHGNGLGLSLVKRIAEAHGGRVTVKSAPGEGSTFTLHLPAAAPDAVPHPLTEPASEAGGPRA